jgi:cytochrome P450
MVALYQVEARFCDLDRWPNRHQAFGLGAHRCLGSNLGRVQFQEVLKATLVGS